MAVLFANPSWVSMEISRLVINGLERGEYFHSDTPRESLLLQDLVVIFPWKEYEAHLKRKRKEDSKLAQDLRELYWTPVVESILGHIGTLKMPFNSIAAVVREAGPVIDPAYRFMISPLGIYQKAEEARKHWSKSPQWPHSVGLVMIVCLTSDFSMSTVSGLVERQNFDPLAAQTINASSCRT